MLAGSHFGWQAQLPTPVQKFKPEIPPWSIQTFPTAFGSSLVHNVGDQASLGVVGGDPFFKITENMHAGCYAYTQRAGELLQHLFARLLHRRFSSPASQSSPASLHSPACPASNSSRVSGSSPACSGWSASKRRISYTPVRQSCRAKPVLYTSTSSSDDTQ